MPKRSFSPFRRFIAFFVSVCFILSESVSYAAPLRHSEPATDSMAGEESQASRSFVSLRSTQDDVREISIPPELGQIEESWVPDVILKTKSEESQRSFGPIGPQDDKKTVIYLQDAHDSLEAQENIAKLIHYFVEHYGVKTVFEEGYEGPVPTDEYFGFIQDPQIKEKVSYFLLDKLRIGGAEYAHINRTKDFKLIGADSIKLHLENIHWYRENAKHQEETQRDLNALQKEIDRLANRHFPKGLKEWIKLKKRFDDKQIPLLDYLKRTLSLRGDAPREAEVAIQVLGRYGVVLEAPPGTRLIKDRTDFADKPAVLRSFRISGGQSMGLEGVIKLFATGAIALDPIPYDYLRGRGVFSHVPTPRI